ncbi:MAG: hypothetical protein PSV16_06585 [Flavobacterium sp.]|nr:hypothetical protein [Flavobacterium sp.]
MKKLLNTFCAIWLLLAAVPAIAGGNDDDIHKEKNINKAYIVNADAGINISNKYGNIYVTTWDENKIAIDVVIKVSGKNEASVDKLLNAIDVDLNALTTMVTAKTTFSGNTPRNTSMEINYTIKIPRHGSIKLNNQYGAIILDKIQGKSDIDCKYGDVTAAELQNSSNYIHLEYCSGSSIGIVKNIKIDAKYSGINISKSGNISADLGYTNLTVKEADNISYDANYGDLNFADVNNLNGTGNYMSLKFGTINSNMNINTNYSSIEVRKISAKANNIAITANYTNINMRYDSDYAFDFDINLRYAGLDSALTFQSKKESNNSNNYKGFYKTTGTNKMSITSGYGNLKLTKI